MIYWFYGNFLNNKFNDLIKNLSVINKTIQGIGNLLYFIIIFSKKNNIIHNSLVTGSDGFNSLFSFVNHFFLLRFAMKNEENSFHVTCLYKMPIFFAIYTLTIWLIFKLKFSRTFLGPTPLNLKRYGLPEGIYPQEFGKSWNKIYRSQKYVVFLRSIKKKEIFFRITYFSKMSTFFAI